MATGNDCHHTVIKTKTCIIYKINGSVNSWTLQEDITFFSFGYTTKQQPDHTIIASALAMTPPNILFFSKN